MDNDELKRNKARAMRYKRAILSELNLETIQDELYTISGECDDVRWYFDDEETLLNAFDGNEEQEFEFKIMFSDLSYECEKLYNMLREIYVTEHFNDFFVGIMSKGTSNFTVLGFDTIEEDYYKLADYDENLAVTESRKRLMRLKKETLLSVCGQCFGIAMSYFNIRYKYDYLKSAFDILRDDNNSILEVIKSIEAVYEKASIGGWDVYSQSYKDFDALTNSLPEKIWIE